MSAPNGAGVQLVVIARLNEVIDEVSRRREHERSEPLTRAQAVKAQALARDALARGWNASRVVEVLAECSAFTRGAFDFAADQLDRQRRPRRLSPERMSAAERDAEVIRRAVSGEDGKS